MSATLAKNAFSPPLMVILLDFLIKNNNSGERVTIRIEELAQELEMCRKKMAYTADLMNLYSNLNRWPELHDHAAELYMASEHVASWADNLKEQKTISAMEEKCPNM